MALSANEPCLMPCFASQARSAFMASSTRFFAALEATYVTAFVVVLLSGPYGAGCEGRGHASPTEQLASRPRKSPIPPHYHFDPSNATTSGAQLSLIMRESTQRRA